VFVPTSFVRALCFNFKLLDILCSAGVCVHICRNLSVNPIVVVESGAFIGLTHLERLWVVSSQFNTYSFI